MRLRLNFGLSPPPPHSRRRLDRRGATQRRLQCIIALSPPRAAARSCLQAARSWAAAGPSVGFRASLGRSAYVGLSGAQSRRELLASAGDLSRSFAARHRVHMIAAFPAVILRLPPRQSDRVRRDPCK